MPSVHFIAHGQQLLRNGRLYPAGSQAPEDLSPAERARYLERGLLESRDLTPAPVVAPKPSLVVTPFVHRDWSPSEPETIGSVPTRVIPALLMSLGTIAEVEAVRQAEEKGKARPVVLRGCAARIEQIGA
jgi:hypothetical protein